LSKEELQAVRMHLIEHADKWRDLTNNNEFKQTFDVVQGERNKRLPSELASAAEGNPDVFLKQFYYMHECSVAEALGANALDYFHKVVAAAEPVRQFLREAISKS